MPEGRQIFPTLTVRENLVATAANRQKRRDCWTLERIYDLFPRMRERAGQAAGTLSGGEQQMLAIGRALMTNPWLLILDEATEGLAPVIRAEIWSVIRKLRASGQSILLIDKNLSVLKHLADRHYIIEKAAPSGQAAARIWNATTNRCRAMSVSETICLVGWGAIGQRVAALLAERFPFSHCRRGRSRPGTLPS